MLIPLLRSSGGLLPKGMLLAQSFAFLVGPCEYRDGAALQASNEGGDGSLRGIAGGDVDLWSWARIEDGDVLREACRSA